MTEKQMKKINDDKNGIYTIKNSEVVHIDYYNRDVVYVTTYFKNNIEVISLKNNFKTIFEEKKFLLNLKENQTSCTSNLKKILVCEAKVDFDKNNCWSSQNINNNFLRTLIENIHDTFPMDCREAIFNELPCKGQEFILDGLCLWKNNYLAKERLSL